LVRMLTQAQARPEGEGATTRLHQHVRRPPRAPSE
jgi:hypothetical protein